jgi:hypothetical protein
MILRQLFRHCIPLFFAQLGRDGFALATADRTSPTNAGFPLSLR